MKELKSIESLTSIKGLKKDIDYKVVSLVAMDHSFEMHTLYDFLDEETVKQIQKNMPKLEEIEEMHRDIMEVSKIPISNNAVLFKTKGEVNFENAILCGLGVVEMLTGEFKGEYLLFKGDSIVDSEFEEMEQALMLTLYTQLTYEEYDNKKLEAFVNEYEDLILTMSPMGDALLSKIKKVYQSKKGGNNVVQFKST